MASKEIGCYLPHDVANIDGQTVFLPPTTLSERKKAANLRQSFNREDAPNAKIPQLLMHVWVTWKKREDNSKI
jgi:hypothetical protein